LSLLSFSSFVLLFFIKHSFVLSSAAGTPGGIWFGISHPCETAVPSAPSVFCSLVGPSHDHWHDSWFRNILYIGVSFPPITGTISYFGCTGIVLKAVVVPRVSVKPVAFFSAGPGIGTNVFERIANTLFQLLISSFLSGIPVAITGPIPFVIT